MLDSIFFDVWDGPSFGVGKRGRNLLRRGTEANATIVGLKVSRTGSDGDGSNSNHHFYALDVAQPLGPPIRLGCRQNLQPHRGTVGLGSEVVVRYRRWRVIIDWEATLDRLGVDHGGLAASPELWKPKRTPVGEGVEDHEQNGARKRVANGRAAKATVLEIHAIDGVFGTVVNVNVDVALAYEDGTTGRGELKRIIPPDYAARLLKPGAVLPVGVDKGGSRVTVDWVAAANANPVRAVPPTLRKGDGSVQASAG